MPTVTFRRSGSTVHTTMLPLCTLRIVATPTGIVVRRDGESGLLWCTLVTNVRAICVWSVCWTKKEGQDLSEKQSE